jgi:molybdenum cofactor cytidylyltransferase
VSRKIAAVVLAAGRSSRMAARNKLMEEVDGEPIVRRVVGLALGSGADPVIVVTGFDASRIGAALSDLKVTIVDNSDFEAGLSSSLKAGLIALSPDVDGALILLGDMPAVDTGVLDTLVEAFTSRDAICVPVHQERRGNPVLWGASYFAQMMRLTGDIGAKTMLAQHTALVTEVPVGSDSIFADVDTPADLARLRTSGIP